MMRLLFIEDEPEVLEPVVKLITQDQADAQCKVFTFAQAEEKIVSLRPHIVILDLLSGGASPEPGAEGIKTRDFIWAKHFCPLIIYSARPEIHDEKYDAHPFVKSVQKGKGSPAKVLSALKELGQHVEVLNEAENHIWQSFSIVMRDIAPNAFATYTDSEQRIKSITRSGRRRLAAMMDGLSNDGAKLASWEHYLCPPVSSDINLGDILRTTSGQVDDPSSFRIVLTPSCDLVASGGRVPKVKQVLTAKCHSMKDGLDIIGWTGIGHKKLKERIPNAVLSQGYFEAMIPFPCLKGQIPTMAASLRDLEFVPLDDIGGDGKPFFRIASIDSPFRELIAWAYLNTACRPGLPDRDFNSWCDEIIATLDTGSGN